MNDLSDFFCDAKGRTVNATVMRWGPVVQLAQRVQPVLQFRMLQSDPRLRLVQPALLVLSGPIPPKAPTDQTARLDPQLLKVRMVRSDPAVHWVQPIPLVLSDPRTRKAPTDQTARSDPEARTAQSRHLLLLIQTVLLVQPVLSLLEPLSLLTRPSRRAALSNLKTPLLRALRIPRLLQSDPPR